eukprot:TRINITY_DN1911_c0_g1_i2.p1 TRINITY_DN1911_c0_g1~~TRINITY_DN1911_c0_g1_i2.p1  ORF type:complete len:173 (-),score=34.16 TRINITY_DN1911_c0_g1_i2:52-570(-)
MGNLATVFQAKKRESTILMVGLDATGKSTLLFGLKYGEQLTTIPNLCNETFPYRNIHFTIWDAGAQFILWKHFYRHTQAVIFVIDSIDRERIGEASKLVQKMLSENELKDAPLLILANKQDLPNAMNVAEVTDKLGMDSTGNRKWYIQPCCAKSGDGLFAGLDWLAHTLHGI